jgi:asparagine synthase (glutamine-hydrolysing)
LLDEIVNRGKGGFEPPLDKWILNEKYGSILDNGIAILEDVGLEHLVKFYKTKILKKNNKLYNIYKIRLFLFVKWWKKWIM